MYIKPFFVKLNTYKTFSVETSRPNIRASSVIFQKNCPKKRISQWAKIPPIWSPCRQATVGSFEEILALLLAIVTG
jgi:hypothetical protein